jgi:hypothetical protein
MNDGTETPAARHSCLAPAPAPECCADASGIHRHSPVPSTRRQNSKLNAAANCPRHRSFALYVFSRLASRTASQNVLINRRTPGTTYPRFPRTPPCPALHRCRPASPRENDCACPFSGAGDARRGGLPIASERLPRRKSGQGRRSKGSCGLPGALSKLLGRRSRSLHMRRGPKQTPRCSPGR